MTTARVCPSCRRLGSAGEARCGHCGEPMRSAAGDSRGAYTAHLAATKMLILLCVVNFAMVVIMNGSLPFGLFTPSAERPAIVGAGGIAGTLAQVQPWRLLSANFVHLSLLHLGINMYALLSFGRNFEERFDGPRLVVTYAVTGIAGFALSSFYYSFSPTTAGASAALFGLIGVEIAYLFARRDPQAKDVLFQYAFMAVALAFVFPVNNFAHLGGFLAGLPVGFWFHKEREPARFSRLWRYGAVAVTIVSIVSVALSLLTLFVIQSDPGT